MVERQLSYIEAIAEGLVQAMEENEKVFLMGEGVDNVTGIYGTILPAYRKFGERRVIDTPLCENALTGIACGAAMDGMIPVLFHQRNDFSLLSLDQLVNHIAKIPYVSAGRHKVPFTMVSFVARKVGEGVQHSQSLQALFAHIPGLNVVMPTSPYDAKGLLISAILSDQPTIVLYHRALFDEKEAVPKEFFTLPFGKARILRGGRDITIVATSAAVKDALEAREILENENGIRAEVIDLRSIKPLDSHAILSSVFRTGRLLVVDTGWEAFGVSAEILALVSERSLENLKSRPRRVGMAPIPAPASPALLKNYHPTAEKICRVVREMIPFS